MHMISNLESQLSEKQHLNQLLFISREGKEGKKKKIQEVPC